MDMGNEKTLKVVPFSDLHGYLFDPKSLPECDVACCCGDFVPLEYQNDDVASIAWFCLEFVPWVDKLPCKKFILLSGNHDFFLEHIMLGPVREDGTRKCRTALEVLKKLLPGNNKGKHKIVYLRDSSVEIDGKKFYGTPWTTGLPGWAFACTEEEFADHLTQMPKVFDVLLTHMPPSLCDVGTVLQAGRGYGRNYSSQTLADAMLKREIKWTFCGHVHSGNHVPGFYGFEESSKDVDDLHGSTIIDDRVQRVVNVSVKDEDYRVQTYYFPVFEI